MFILISSICFFCSIFFHFIDSIKFEWNWNQPEAKILFWVKTISNVRRFIIWKKQWELFVLHLNPQWAFVTTNDIPARRKQTQQRCRLVIRQPAAPLHEFLPSLGQPRSGADTRTCWTPSWPILVRAIVIPKRGMEGRLQTPQTPRSCSSPGPAGKSCWSLDASVAVFLVTLVGALFLLMLYKLLQLRHRCVHAMLVFFPNFCPFNQRIINVLLACRGIPFMGV